MTPFAKFLTDGKECRYEAVVDISAVVMTALNDAARD
jgi:hypothetical protein